MTAALAEDLLLGMEIAERFLVVAQAELTSQRSMADATTEVLRVPGLAQSRETGPENGTTAGGAARVR